MRRKCAATVCHSTAPSSKSCRFIHRTSLGCSFLGLGRKKLEFLQNVSLAGSCYFWPVLTPEHDEDLLPGPLHLRLAAPTDLGVCRRRPPAKNAAESGARREQMPGLLARHITILICPDLEVLNRAREDPDHAAEEDALASRRAGLLRPTSPWTSISIHRDPAPF